MNKQDFLNNYFGNIWYISHKPSTADIPSGLQLIDKILPHEHVIDIGCGENPFKNKITNLIGIDPAFDQADVKCTIEEFTTDKLFDVAFCLGSINFGDQIVIKHQIKKVVSLLKPSARIYWRCNPGKQDHANEECKAIEFYPWTFEDHKTFSKEYGFELKECKWENNGRRIYAEWIRS